MSSFIDVVESDDRCPDWARAAGRHQCNGVVNRDSMKHMILICNANECRVSESGCRERNE